MPAPAQTQKSLLPSAASAHSSRGENSASMPVSSRAGDRIRSFPDVEERSCLHFPLPAQSFPPALSGVAIAARRESLDTTARSIGVPPVYQHTGGYQCLSLPLSAPRSIQYSLRIQLSLAKGLGGCDHLF